MPSLQTLNFLPQHQGNWYSAFRLIPAWLRDEKNSEQFTRPWMIFIVDMDTGAIINLNLINEKPSPNQAYDFFTQSMVTPAQNSVTSQRPLVFHFEDQTLADEMEVKLKPLRIKTVYNPQKEVTDEIVENLLPVILQGQIPLQGLMEQRGVKIELVKNIFHSAADVWDLRPWNTLNNEDIIAFWVEGQKTPYYVSLMGSGGLEFGFTVFKTQKEIHSFFVDLAAKQTKIPEKGRHVFLYNQPPLVSFEDMDFAAEHNLPLPSLNYFPTPLLFKPDDIYRPSATMLRWYEAVLLVLPKLVDDLHPDKKPLEQEYLVHTVKGETEVKVKYPAFNKEKINFWKNDGLLTMMTNMQERSR